MLLLQPIFSIKRNPVALRQSDWPKVTQTAFMPKERLELMVSWFLDQDLNHHSIYLVFRFLLFYRRNWGKVFLLLFLTAVLRKRNSCSTHSTQVSKSEISKPLADVLERNCIDWYKLLEVLLYNINELSIEIHFIMCQLETKYKKNGL